MAIRFRLLSVVVIALALGACTLPGAASPTPFTFPTPNMTLTAIFAPTSTWTPAPPTLPPPPTEVPSPTVGFTPSTPGTPATPVATLPPGTTTSRPNGAPVTAAFLATPPTIDGDLSDWSTPPYTVSACVFGCSNRTGETDLSGTYYIGHDSSNLYLAVKVKDEKYVQLATGHDIYKGDDVEIQLDSNLAGDYSSTTLSGDDFQVGLSDGNFGTHPPEAYRWYPQSLAGSLTTAVVKGKLLSDGYTLEAKIPWAVFNVLPSPGMSFGFALSLSDDDLAGTAIQQSMVSTVSTRKLLNPATWGTLTLGPTGGS